MSLTFLNGNKHNISLQLSNQDRQIAKYSTLLTNTNSKVL